nr:hypothetical protein [Tanacetum cinerariifolium]
MRLLHTTIPQVKEKDKIESVDVEKNRKARRWVYVQRLQAEEQGGDVIQHRAVDGIVLSRKIGKGFENKIKKQIREEDKRKKKTTTTSDSTVEE